MLRARDLKVTLSRISKKFIRQKSQVGRINDPKTNFRQCDSYEGRVRGPQSQRGVQRVLHRLVQLDHLLVQGAHRLHVRLLDAHHPPHVLRPVWAQERRRPPPHGALPDSLGQPGRHARRVLPVCRLYAEGVG